MNNYELWEKSLESTQIIRTRISPLSIEEKTRLPYIFLAPSAVNANTTVIRKGFISVEKPSLFLTGQIPSFEGFEENILDDISLNFLLVRGIQFPSLKYLNKIKTLDIYEGECEEAIEDHLEIMTEREDTHTGLLTGGEDHWQYSVLIFVLHVISSSSEKDAYKILRNNINKTKDRY